MIFFITLCSILALQQPHVKNFLKAAAETGQYKYALVTPTKCSSGKLKNSYVLAQNGVVVFKQISKDKSIGPVCKK
jgi:hypothetical protein